LVLDKEEVHLKEGDTVVQRGTNHAWSNRSDEPCVIIVSPTTPPTRPKTMAEVRKLFRRVVTGNDAEPEHEAILIRSPTAATGVATGRVVQSCI
jgi:hypothetical protein